MVDRPPGSNKKFPEIVAYPQVPSAYQIIEPYVDFVADLEADRVRSEVMHSDVKRSQTSNTPTRSSAAIRSKSRGDPKPSVHSPRQIKTAPAKEKQPMTGQVDMRDRPYMLKKHSPAVSVLCSSQPPEPKSPFEKAVESLAAMKMHDYALKRKERMRNRYRVCFMSFL